MAEYPVWECKHCGREIGAGPYNWEHLTYPLHAHASGHMPEPEFTPEVAEWCRQQDPQWSFWAHYWLAEQEGRTPPVYVPIGDTP